MGRGEAEDLRAEADLPLDELLAKYQTPAGAAAARSLRKKENFQSPAVKAKQGQGQGQGHPEAGEAGPSSSTDAAGGSNPSSSSSSGGGGGSAYRSSCARLTNGLADSDNENNLNTEKELQDTVGGSDVADPTNAADDPSPADVSGNSSSSADNKVPGKRSAAPEGGGGSGDSEKKSVVSVADSSSGSGDAAGGSGGGGGGCSSSSPSAAEAAGGGGCDVGSTSCSSGQSPGKSSDPSDGVSSSTSGVSVALKKKKKMSGVCFFHRPAEVEHFLLSRRASEYESLLLY